MKSKVLLYAALLIDVIAALKIFARRVEFEKLSGGLINSHNVPLAALLLAIFVLVFYRRRKLTIGLLVVLFSTSLLFLICSDYIPSTGPFHVKASVLGYSSLILQFSEGIVVNVFKGNYFAKIVATVVVIAAALTLAGFVFTFSKPKEMTRKGDPGIAVVLGTTVLGPHKPGFLLLTRLKEALAMFKSGMVGKVAVTGGVTGLGISQAKVEAWYVHHYGVPDSDIIIEDKSENTIEQAIFVRKVLVDSLRMKHIAIVSDPWHLPRSLLMCRWQGVDAYAAPCKNKLIPYRELLDRFRESAALQVYILFGE